MDDPLRCSLEAVARYYDERKVGELGPLGFRRSTPLGTLLGAVDRLVAEEILVVGRCRLLDLGCADGRVNVLLSYLVRHSIGVELDEWTLEEYQPLRGSLDHELSAAGLELPPDNVQLFHGDGTDPETYRGIERATGLRFDQFDLFYTFLLGCDAYAELIARAARPGAVFIVYGLDRILPRYPGLALLEALSPLEGAMALYRKE